MHGDPAPVDLVGDVHALGVNGLHLEAELGLALALLHAHLLKEDVGAVEDGARVAGGGALTSQERRQLARLDATLLGEAVADGAAERGLRDVGLLEEGADLLAHLVARVVDGDGLAVLAVEPEAARVERLARLLLGDVLARARLGLLGRQRAEALQLALLEELERGRVRVAVHALVRARHRHEVLVAARRHADGLLELLHLHVAAIDEVPDLAADLLAALVDVVQAGVVVRDVGDVVGLLQELLRLLHGIRLALSG